MARMTIWLSPRRRALINPSPPPPGRTHTDASKCRYTRKMHKYGNMSMLQEGNIRFIRRGKGGGAVLCG